MTFETINYQVEDRILTITLNRPDRMNALNVTMMQELISAFQQADEDDEVKAIIVTGAGKAFCAGADLGAGADTFDYDEESASSEKQKIVRDGGGLVTLQIFQCKKPVIAAINGAAAGVGSTMTLPMDIRLASTKAKFGFVFARRGIVPEAASSWFLPRVVGISKALEWSFSGDVFPAEEALNGGLVRSLHEPEDLLPAARKIAANMVENCSSLSLALTRQMMWRMLGADHPMEAHMIDSRAVQALGKKEDAKEGVMSFLEKRPAQFTNKVSTDMPEFFPWWEEPEFK